LNSKGSIDGTFDVGTGFDSTVSEITRQADGKFLVGGSFTSFNEIERRRMVVKM